MPARRSRTARWRQCLSDLCERGGSLEIAVARSGGAEDAATHLIWRVRVVGQTEDAILVEPPSALGQTFHLEQGLDLVGILAIGQNRWMFRTRLLDAEAADDRRGRGVLRLSMPTEVERCQRRNFYRVETAALTLPEADVWPLLEPRSVFPAERANEVAFENGQAGGGAIHLAEQEDLMPDVGPRFKATIVNIGGGGMGMNVEPQDAQVLGSRKLFWLRFSLPPTLTTPICATAKVVHTHVQSNQHLYAGVAFDFTFNPSHQRFVVEQILKYVESLTAAQRRDVA